MEVIDDVLSVEDYKSIADPIMSAEWPWFKTEPVSVHPGVDAKQEMHMLFTHLFYKNDTIASDRFCLLKPLLDLLPYKSLIRIKANMYPHTETIVRHAWHRDMEFECKTVLYHLNTNNGYTIIGKTGEKVESKANRLVIFDSSQVHASTSCTDQNYRYNINYNYF